MQNQTTYYTKLSVKDYHPFGMTMPGRHKLAQSGEEYRFGFNGQEKNNDISGTDGGHLDFKYRIHDARLGRFLSVDPLTASYPFYSSYQFAGNMPTFARDLEGLEPEKILNEAEKYLGTPYQYGGKNPHPNYIGYLNENKSNWQRKMVPVLKKYYKFYNTLFFSKNQYYSGQSWKFKANVWETFVNLTYELMGVTDVQSSGYSLGIDCSGLTRVCYAEDLTMLVNDIGAGSSGQLQLFKNAMKEGKAYVHQNPNLISKGDFVYNPGHVMIATGNVKLDANGNVTQFETIEANGSTTGVIFKWRTWESKYTVAHPYRTSDYVREWKGVPYADESDNGYTFYLFPSEDPSCSGYSEDSRTEDNLNQTVITNP